MPKTNRKLHDGHFTISQKIYWEFKKQTNKKTPQPTTTKPTQKNPTTHHNQEPFQTTLTKQSHLLMSEAPRSK